MDLQTLLTLRESEDKVEFKAATKNFKYNGGDNREPKDRRHCVLGYVTAFCNEGGGMLVLGVSDQYPHKVVGTNFAEGKEGELIDKIYADIAIRVSTEVLTDEEGKRVLAIHIPGRPIGRPVKFEGVALMRTGESLREMSDAELFNILSEQEPDFSAKVCQELSREVLHPDAIIKMKNAYAAKQKNTSFTRLSDEQVLNDLGLLAGDRLNYAALLLLGKKTALETYLPQAKVVWEFRFTESQISYDFRQVISEPLFIGIDRVWELINDKNAEIQVRDGAYITSLKTFNEEVIREAILNAIAHRDYTITSEVVIKQYPKKIVITNPGGFPKGVTVENLLTINSTPRSRLMAEVLEKTGLVERSGQGVDKIYSITLSEGKPEPDYKDSNLFQVTLKLDGNVKDKAFNVYVSKLQEQRPDNQRLSVEEIVTLHKVKSGAFAQVKPDLLVQLERDGLIKRASTSGHTKRYVLRDEYYQVASKEQRIGSRYVVVEVEQFLLAIQGRELKIGDLEEELSSSLNRNQIKYLISKLYQDQILKSSGQGRGTKYFLAEAYASLKGDALISEVVSSLRESFE